MPHSTPTIRTATDEPISETVIAAVSAALDDDPLALPPLFEAIDPDALDRVVEYGDRERRSGIRIEFEYAGCDVRVDAAGRVVVSPSEPGDVTAACESGTHG